MKLQKLLRKVHYWGSIAVMLPLGVIAVTGVLLMLKKELDWIQPETQVGVITNNVPTKTLDELYLSVSRVPQLSIESFQDFKRVDIKPNKGIVKFVTVDGWDIQIDSNTAEVLQVARRRSDLIESIHDGSLFSTSVKYVVFLPAGIMLLFLWMTGIYLFFLPRLKKRAKKNPIEHSQRCVSKDVQI